MDHSEAIRLEAPERYCLGELTSEQREQFEEHYFTCPECALEVKTATVFVESARKVLGSNNRFGMTLASIKFPTSGGVASLRPVYVPLAFGVLLGLVCYQNFFAIPRLKSTLLQSNAPQLLTSLSLTTQNSRGAAPSTLTVSPDKPFGLYVDVPPQPRLLSYTCELQTEDGRPKFSTPVSAQEAEGTVQLLVPPSLVRPGKYFLVIRGREQSASPQAPATEIARYSFAVEFRH